MDKYQEALDCLKDTKCDEINNCKQCSLTSYCGHYQCIKTLQELVDKATPKKPIRFIDKFYVSPYKCPVCKTIPHTGNQKYCDECGQALDWSEK